MDIDVVWFLQGQSCVVNAYQDEVSTEIEFRISKQVCDQQFTPLFREEYLYL